MSISPPEPPLADDVVALRPLGVADLAGIEQALKDPEIIGWFGRSDATATEFLDGKRKGWDDGTAMAFAICDPRNEFVGQVFVELGEAATADLGYWLLPEGRGHGYATRSVRLVSQWVLTKVGVARLQMWIQPENAASLAVAERSGFVREGTLRSYREREGHRFDAIFYSLLPRDLHERG